MGQPKQDFRRIQISVPPDLKDRFDKVFKWGEWNQVGISIIEWILEMHDKFGDAIFLAFRRGDVAELIRKGIKDAQDKKE